MDALAISRHSQVEHVCEALRKQAVKHGFQQAAQEIDGGRLVYDVIYDPSGSESLRGIWRGDDGWKRGQLLFHADGSFFAEYDVVRAHPEDPRWFVEAVEAWGRDEVIKSDLRLLLAV